MSFFGTAACMNAPSSPPSPTDHDAQAAALPERIGQLVADSTRALHSQLNHMVESTLADLHTGHARRLNEVEQACTRLQADMQATRTLYESEQRAHSQALVDNATLETQLDKAQRDNQALLARLDAAAQSIEQLHRERDQQQRNVADLQAQQQADASALAASREQSQQLGASLDAAHSALHDLQARLDEAAAGAEQARQQHARQEAEQTTARTAQDAAMQGLQQELRELNDALGTANSSLSDLKIRLWHAEAESEGLRGSNTELSNQAATQQQRLDELARNLEQVSQRERKSSTLIAEAKEVLAESKQTISRLEAKLREARQEADALRPQACAKAGQGLPGSR